MKESYGYRKVLDEHLSHRFEIHNAKPAHYRMCIDRFFRRAEKVEFGPGLQNIDYWFTVAYQSNFYSERGSSCFVEVEKMENGGTPNPGFSRQCLANVAIYWWPISRELWWVSPYAIKENLSHWGSVHLLSPWIGEEGKRQVRGLLIPKAEFFAAVGIEKEKL